MIVSVIAGGWSFREVAHSRVPGWVIAVNDAMLWLQRPVNSIVTMDRLWIENRWESCEHRGIETYARENTLKNIRERPEWLHPYKCDRQTTLFGGLDPLTLNGRNSGACAINLAHIMHPTELYLFGFDMCRSPEGKAHWYKPYEWGNKGDAGQTGTGAYREWARDFAAYASQFEDIGTKVYNVSPDSAITAFKKVSAEEIGCRA